MYHGVLIMLKKYYLPELSEFWGFSLYLFKLWQVCYVPCNNLKFSLPLKNCGKFPPPFTIQRSVLGSNTLFSYPHPFWILGRFSTHHSRPATCAWMQDFLLTYQWLTILLLKDFNVLCKFFFMKYAVQVKWHVN